MWIGGEMRVGAWRRLEMMILLVLGSRVFVSVSGFIK